MDETLKTNGVPAVHWLRRNAIGLVGFALSVVAIVVGADAYRSEIKRAEQARAIPLRLERGEVELAEQHRKGVAALSELAEVERSVTYIFAAGAFGVGLWAARRRQTSLWLFAATIVLIIAGVALAMGSRV